VFDKTGTLTTGRLAVSRLNPLDGIPPAELLRCAASAEQFSNHPTARSITAMAQEAGVPLAKAANRDAMANPAALDWFIEYQRTQTDYTM